MAHGQGLKPPTVSFVAYGAAVARQPPFFFVPGGESRIMAHKNLEDAIRAAKSPVKMLRNSQIGPYAFPVVPSEFTNWRDEQRSWRETCALFDQSHHMTDLLVE